MADPFLSEIRVMSFQYAPRGWAMCNGQLLPVDQNQALFSLLGTTFGGDGQVTFALPDLRGRTPIHAGNGFTLGASGGEQTHTLSLAELPPHVHVPFATPAPATTSTPSFTVMLAQAGQSFLYGPPSNVQQMAGDATTAEGSSQAYPNMQPFLTLNFCIALQGIYPSRS